MKIERINIVKRPRQLPDDLRIELCIPETPEEQSRVNAEAGFPACERCGLHTHSTEAHDLLTNQIELDS